MDGIENALSGDSKFDDMFANDGELVFETCYDKTTHEINGTLQECFTTASTSSCSDPTVYDSGKVPQCGPEPKYGYLPQCPDDIYDMFEDFGSAYPSDEAG